MLQHVSCICVSGVVHVHRGSEEDWTEQLLQLDTQTKYECSWAIGLHQLSTDVECWTWF